MPPVERLPLTSRRVRDITGIVLLIVGVLIVLTVAVYAAFAWHPLAGVAAVGVCMAAAGYLLGRE